MSKRVEGAVASCCNDIIGHFVIIRNELWKFVELKFDFFSFNTFDVFQIFWQRVVQPRPKYSYSFFLKGLYVLRRFESKIFFEALLDRWLTNFIWFQNLMGITFVNNALCAHYTLIRIFHKSYYEIVSAIIMNVTVIPSTFCIQSSHFMNLNYKFQNWANHCSIYKTNMAF